MTTRLFSWSVAESVKAALKSKTPTSSLRDLSATNRTHRTTVSTLSEAELAKLVSYDIEALGFTAYFLAENDRKLEAALRVFDALLKAPLERLDARHACNAAYWLGVANLRHVDLVRSKAYVERFGSLARENSALYLNCAILEMQRGEPELALGWLRRGVEEGVPSVLEKAARSTPLQLLHKSNDFEVLRAIEPSYPPALRSLQLGLVVQNRDLTDAAKKADLARVDGAFSSDGLIERHGLKATASRTFVQFARTDDGGTFAFWKRASLAVEGCPVVVFGADGTSGVHSTDLVGFGCLFAHGIGVKDATHATAEPRFALKKKVLKQVVHWLPEAAERNPEREWKQVLALGSAFHQAVRRCSQ